MAKHITLHFQKDKGTETVEVYDILQSNGLISQTYNQQHYPGLKLFIKMNMMFLISAIIFTSTLMVNRHYSTLLFSWQLLVFIVT